MAGQGGVEIVVVVGVVRSTIDPSVGRSYPGRSSEGVTTVEGDWGFDRLRWRGIVRDRVREERVGMVSKSNAQKRKRKGKEVGVEQVKVKYWIM